MFVSVTLQSPTGNFQTRPSFDPPRYGEGVGRILSSLALSPHAYMGQSSHCWFQMKMMVLENHATVLRYQPSSLFGEG